MSESWASTVSGTAANATTHGRGSGSGDTGQHVTLADFLLARIAEDEECAREIRPFDVTPGSWPSAAWVLAVCESHRRIIAVHRYSRDGGHCCADPEDAFGELMYWCEPCPTLRALALPYADHADFRPEWRG